MTTNRQKRITAADLFCGAGGSSTGLRFACEALGITLKLIAVNHWEIAIDTHAKNHPDAEHLCLNLDNVNPRKLIPSGKLDLLIASPECTHHSKARGGKPINDQSRASAWRIVEWCSQITVNHVLIENVKEFRTWGPLGSNGRPLKRRKGETYQAFLNALRALGYTVEDRVLNAANYGDPTSRERLFIQARRGKKPIAWPEPTHGPTIATKPSDNVLLFDKSPIQRRPYRTAREIIDWSIPSESIFNRKRPLAPNTLSRILKGLQKFAGLPVIVPQMSGGSNRGLDQPIPTITTTSRGIGLCEPFIVELRNNQNVRSLDDPLSTIATSGAHHGICEPFIIAMEHGGHLRSIDKPLNTITTARGGAHGLCEPFIIPVNHGDDGHKNGRSRSINDPVPTITTSFSWALIEPYLVKYNGTGGPMPVSEPLDTVTAKDRFGLVEPSITPEEGKRYILDIRFRMLQPHELAAAMSFPKTYHFTGNREQKVKQIGNAVPVNLSQSLCRAILKEAA